MTPREMAQIAMRVPGLTREDELTWLADHALDAKIVVEVGCLWGRSTKALALGTHNGSFNRGKVFAIDTWQGSPDEPPDAQTNIDPPGVAFTKFCRNLGAEIAEGIVYPTTMDSTAGAQHLKQLGYTGKIDMLFLDGSHSYDYVRQDLVAWLPLIRRGGLVCGHNIDHEGVRLALQHCLSAATRRVDQIWACRV